MTPLNEEYCHDPMVKSGLSCFQHVHWNRSMTLVSLLFFLISGYSQNQPISVLTVNNGLSSGTVQCGLYDSRGFMWFGTREGLHRYDGKNLVKFLPNPDDSLSIHSSEIQALAEDSHGRIFIVGSGLEVYLPETNTFQVIQSTVPGIPTVRSDIWLREDLGIGIVIALNGPLVFSLDDLKPLIDSAEYSDQVKAYVSQLWKFNGLQFYKGPLNEFQQILDRSKMVRFANTAKDDVWVALGQAGGFVLLEHEADTVKWLPLKGLDSLVSTQVSLKFMDYDDSDGVAAVDGFGMVLFNKTSGWISKYWDFRSDPALSRFTTITPLFRDPAGRIWFTLMPYGVFVLDSRSHRFQKLNNRSPGSLLYHGLMRSMTSDIYGRLWIGYQDGILQILNSTLDKEIYRDLIFNNAFASDRAVHSLVLLPNGNVFANGFLEFKPGLNQDDPPRLLTPKKENSLRLSAYNTLGTPKRVAIIGSSGTDSVFIYTGHSQKAYPHHGMINSLDYTFVTDQGHIFTHTSGSRVELHVINGDSLAWVASLHQDRDIRSVYQPPGSDSLWLATTTGLSVFNLCSYTFTDIDVTEWPSQYLYSILPDDMGNLWISSNAGIIRYDPHNGGWKCFNIDDGMQSNEFNTNCYARMPDGSLAFGGPEGLNVFDPRYFDTKNTPFYVHMQRVIVHEQDLTDFNPYQANAVVTVHPDQSSIEFEYTSTAHFDRDELQYFIQLQDADRDWVRRDDKEFVRYINLDPGEYTFRLKARNPDGMWSANTLETRVKVLPAFYQTLWFKGLLILALAALVYMLYRYRIGQLNKLYQIRNQISHDLHDDVGSTLGSISIYSEVAKSATIENRGVVLEKIGEASREMIEKLGDIVWSINPDNDSIEKMEGRMRSHAFMVLNPKGITFHLTIDARDDRVLLDMERRRHLFLIFKEALFNAAKYAECTYVQVVLQEKDGRIFMEISDDGKGFDINSIQAYNGNGLRSMRERALAIHGDLKVNSIQGKGTRITLSVN
jgi:signal transduction histidine kinase/ligand-binding sensor domain-containing protein